MRCATSPYSRPVPELALTRPEITSSRVACCYSRFMNSRSCQLRHGSCIRCRHDQEQAVNRRRPHRRTHPSGTVLQRFSSSSAGSRSRMSSDSPGTTSRSPKTWSPSASDTRCELAATPGKDLTAAQPNSNWVFRCYSPGRHIDPDISGRDSRGVFGTRAARLGTLHELARLAPVAILAEALGHSPATHRAARRRRCR
jgi:hypothetical protein